MSISTWEELHDAVERSGGILRKKAGLLRDLAGFERLGPHVVTQISEKVAAEGMAHLPDPLPHNNQEKVVRIYTTDSMAWRLVRAARNPTAPGDELIRRAVVAMDKADKFDKIRSIACPDDEEDDFVLDF